MPVEVMAHVFFLPLAYMCFNSLENGSLRKANLLGDLAFLLGLVIITINILIYPRPYAYLILIPESTSAIIILLGFAIFLIHKKLNTRRILAYMAFCILSIPPYMLLKTGYGFGYPLILLWLIERHYSFRASQHKVLISRRGATLARL